MYLLVMELPNFNKKNNSSTYDNEIKNISNIETSKNNENLIIISPKKSKESRMTIKPSMIHPEGSFTTKVDHLFESVKEKTSDYFDRVKIKQQDINSFKATTGTTTKTQESNPVPNQQEYIIPVLEEKYIFSKDTVLEDIKIEKKWITHNEKIQVPVSYEKLFVNEKELDSFSNENIFTHIKDKILDFVYVEGSSSENKVENELDEETLHTEQKSMDKNHHTKNKKEIHHQVMGERVPLFDDEKGNLINEKDNNTVEAGNNKKVIPLYAEEIIVTKRKVKVGEIIVTKRKVNEVKKIELDIVKEKVTVDYANGRKENIT